MARNAIHPWKAARKLGMAYTLACFLDSITTLGLFGDQGMVSVKLPMVVVPSEICGPQTGHP